MSNLKHGVLVLQGKDHRSQFWEALNLLTRNPHGEPFPDDPEHPDPDSPDHPSNTSNTGFQPASIKTVWVRKFGPFGVVQLCFEASEDLLSYLKTRLAYNRVFAALHQANPDITSQPDYQPPLLVVTETTEPGHLNHSIEHQVWAGERLDLPNNPDGTRVTDRRLQRFASILASYPGVELAQYDSARFVDHADQEVRLYQVFRLFDHQRRGPIWLEKVVTDADAMLVERDRNPNGSYGFRLQRRDDTHEVGTYLNRMLRMPRDFHDNNNEQGPRDSYLYLLVHCSDHQGLFADLSAFMQSQPAAGERLARRRIFLGACRGMGDQGLIMLATRRDHGGDAEEASLTRRLYEFLETKRRGGHPYARATDRPFQLYDAQVIAAREIPGGAGERTGEHNSITVSARHPHDKPGLIMNICRVVHDHGGDTANFYLVDGHSRRIPGVAATTFDFSMGLVLSNEHAPAVKYHLNEQMARDGWEDIVIETYPL